MRRTIRLLSVCLFAATSASLNAQTREFIDAPVVADKISVQWDAVNKKFLYAIDNEITFRDLHANALFLTQRSIFITFDRINPLRFNATASITNADDPAHGAIAKLLEALVSVASTVSPVLSATSAVSGAATTAAGAASPAGGLAPGGTAPASGSGCPELDAAYVDIVKLEGTLYGDSTSPAGIKKTVVSWIQTVDAAYGTRNNGAAAINDGAIAIGQFAEALDGLISSGSTLVSKIENGSGAVTVAGTCGDAARAAYAVAHIANPRARLAQVKALRATVAKLKDSLTVAFVDAPRWVGPVSYKIGDEIAPTPAKLANVTVKAVKINLSINDDTGAFAVVQEDAGSTAVVVRKYSRLAPEVGLGPVFVFIKQPKFGTTTNAAGQTIVTQGTDQKHNVDAAVLLNFACRCESGPFLTPMFQVGATTSKDVPAILLGGGLRLFGYGKGDFAIGGGGVLGWAKDLDTLKPGDTIAGTDVLDKDLKYGPRFGWYIVAQYKF